jgi:hypothetical protein
MTMLDAASAEALRAGFWPLYILALTAGTWSAVVSGRGCIARTVFALALGSAAMQTIVLFNGGVALEWWQHFVIDGAVFWMVTLPPRHYWQAVIASLIFAQLVFRALWAMVPDLGPVMWEASLIAGYGKCLVLLLWSGGARVETLLGRAARFATRLVPAALKGSVA